MDDPYAVDRRGFLKTSATVAAAASAVACGAPARPLAGADRGRGRDPRRRLRPDRPARRGSRGGRGRGRRSSSTGSSPRARRGTARSGRRASAASTPPRAAATGSRSPSCPPRTQDGRCCRTSRRERSRPPTGRASSPRPSSRLLREYTMMGFYGDPRHGGNKDRVSWRMLGVPGPADPRAAARDARPPGGRGSAMALPRVNAVVVGSGAGGRRRLLPARRGRPQRRLPREGPLALALRGAQGRPRQPAQLQPRRRLRPRRGEEPAGLRGPRGPGARSSTPRPGRVQPQRQLRRRRDLLLRRPGLALHAAGLPDALDLRRPRGLDPRGLAHLLRRPRALVREGRVRDRGERRRRAEPLPGPAAEAAPHAADDAEVDRVRDPQAGGAAAGAAPVRHARSSSTPFPTTAARPACASAGAWASAARRTPRTAPTTPSSRAPSPPATPGCAPSARSRRCCSTTAGGPPGWPYFDEDDRLQEQPADLVVVSGGATESARLLLLSKSRLHPNGLGNRHDWVGRNLNGHTYTGRRRLLRAGDLRRRRPRGVHLGLRLQPRQRRACAGGGMLANEFIRLPYPVHRATSPRAPRRWGKAHKDFMRRYYRRNIMVQGPTQDMPDLGRPGRSSTRR